MGEEKRDPGVRVGVHKHVNDGGSDYYELAVSAPTRSGRSLLKQLGCEECADTVKQLDGMVSAFKALVQDLVGAGTFVSVEASGAGGGWWTVFMTSVHGPTVRELVGADDYPAIAAYFRDALNDKLHLTF